MSRTTSAVRTMLALVLGTALLLSGCSAFPADSSGRPDATAAGPAADVPVREVYRFDSLPVMIATADAVVIGTVIGQKPGRAVGDPGAEIVFNEVSLRVDETVYGNVGASVLLEIEGAPKWATEGTTSLFFLHQKNDVTAQVYYRPLNSQSVFVAAGDRLTTTGDDSFATAVAGLGLAGVRAEIAKALPLIRSGVVEPASCSASTRVGPAMPRCYPSPAPS